MRVVDWEVAARDIVRGWRRYARLDNVFVASGVRPVAVQWWVGRRGGSPRDYLWVEVYLPHGIIVVYRYKPGSLSAWLEPACNSNCNCSCEG